MSHAGVRVGSWALGVVALVTTAGCGGGGNSVSGNGRVQPPDPVVAFLSDRAVDGHDELWVCNADGGSRRKVSGPTGIGYGVTAFAWSPDRTRIAFLDDKTFPGLHDLYVVDPLGATPVLVSGPTAFGKDFTALRWSPDSTKVLLHGSFGPQQDDMLGCVPAAGGSITPLSPPGVHPTFVDGWWWSPDSGAVAFLGRPSPGSASDFWVAEADGSGATKVSGAVVAGGSIDVWATEAWSPDGERVVFRGDKDVDGKTELYTSKRDGTGLVKVSHALAADEDVSTYAWSPVAARLAYVAGHATAPGYSRLYAVDGAGGAVTPVSEDYSHAGTIVWRPNGASIAYLAGSGAWRLGDPVAGTSALLANLDPGDVVVDLDAAWSPDGARLGYRAGDGTPPPYEHFRLFAVAPGSDPVLLSTSVEQGEGNVERDAWGWSPDGATVAYRGREIQFGPRGVHTSPAGGGGDTLWSAPDVDAGPHGQEWSSDGVRLVWQDGTSPGDDRLLFLEAGVADVLVPPGPSFAAILRFAAK
jgi:Tol biopolymer transport system component